MLLTFVPISASAAKGANNRHILSRRGWLYLSLKTKKKELR